MHFPTTTITSYARSTWYTIDELEELLSFEVSSAVPEEATHVCCYDSQVFSNHHHHVLCTV